MPFALLYSAANKNKNIEQLVLRTPKTFHVTIEQDLNPRPSSVNDHPSVLEYEIMTIEPGENPTHILTWKTTVFLRHIQSRSHEDRFPIPLWETWFCQSLGVPIPALLEFRNSLSQWHMMCVFFKVLLTYCES